MRFLVRAGLLIFFAAFLGGCATIYVRTGPLLSTKDESPNYAAYSYILFPRSPVSEFRYKTLLAAYVALPPSPYWIGGPSGKHVKRKLNITYVPVLVEPPYGQLNSIWLAENYDLGRAKRILEDQELYGDGPFIVTSETPLTEANINVKLYVLDLSSAPASSMESWMRYFVSASERREEHWKDTFVLFVTRLHDIFDKLGASAEAVLEVLPNGTKILKAFSGSAK